MCSGDGFVQTFDLELSAALSRVPQSFYVAFPALLGALSWLFSRKTAPTNNKALLLLLLRAEVWRRLFTSRGGSKDES